MSNASLTSTANVPVAKLKKEKWGKTVSSSLNSRSGRILVVFLALFWTIPTFGLLVSSFRPEVPVKTTGWWTGFVRPTGYKGSLFSLDNYRQVLSSGDGQDGLGHFLLNSFRIVIPATFLSVAFAATAAYAFSWMEFKGRDWWYNIVISMLIVPLQMALIPLLRGITGGVHISWATKPPFFIFNKTPHPGLLVHHSTLLPYLGLRNSVAAVWIAHTVFGLPFCVFLLKNFISGLPREIIEAARVDGASHFKTFTRLVLPLSVPAIASLFIFQFVAIWNDYFIGRVFGGSDNKPIIAKLVDVVGTRGQSWHLLTAAGFISMGVPLAVFFALQRYFVRGLLAGSVKG